MRKKVLILPVVYILLQDLLYGFGDPISKSAYEMVPVYTLLSVRYWIAFLFLMFLFGKRILKALGDCRIRELLPPGLCIALTYILSNYAMKLTTATAAAFLRSTSTVLTPLLAFLFLRQKMSRKQIPILFLVMTGLYMLCSGTGFTGFGLGEILAIVSAFMAAASLVFSGKSLENIDPLSLTAFQSLTCAILATLWALWEEHTFTLPPASLSIWMTIVYLAILCTFAGYYLQNLSLRHLSAGSIALWQTLYPVMTALFSRLLLKEHLSGLQTLGAVLILISILFKELIPLETKQIPKKEEF